MADQGRRTPSQAAVVWCPIPVLTWLLPFVGHAGLARADGTTTDFAGPYHVARGPLLFGKPTRRVKNVCKDGNRWDQCVDEAELLFTAKDYDFVAQNCHHFVAETLNLAQYRGRRDWNAVNVAFLCFLRGKHEGWTGLLRTWIPFVLVMTPALYFGTWITAVVWMGLALMAGSAFCINTYFC
eukprot:scaffold126_cov315-Pavlova_lutheri.AAC.27